MFEETALADQPTETTESAEVLTSDFPSMDTSAEGEVADQGEGTTATTTDEGETTYQLPDEQLKVFPAEVYQEYAANRYPELAKMLTDQSLPEPTRKQVQQILHDKLNGDIYIQRLEEQEEQEVEEVEEETEEVADQPPIDPVKAEAERETRINQFVDQVTDPKVATKFAQDFIKSFEIKDPQQRDIAVTKSLTRGIVNLFPDLVSAFFDGKGGFLEKRIESYINQNFEGLTETHKTNTYQSTWDSIKSSDPKFAALPAYSTPEWIQAAQEAAAILPGFENAIFNDPATGRPLSAAKNFQKKAEAMANILSRTRGNVVKEAVQAVETGKRVQAESAQRKNLGKLGAGQSKGQITTGTGNDPLKAAIAAQRADSDPFAALKK